MSRKALGLLGAGECPPRAIGVHRCTLYSRSAHSRGGSPSGMIARKSREKRDPCQARQLAGEKGCHRCGQASGEAQRRDVGIKNDVLPTGHVRLECRSA